MVITTPVECNELEAVYQRHLNSFIHRVLDEEVSYFLVACTRLYKPLCRSVGPSVRRSVRRSVAVHEARDLSRSALLNSHEIEIIIKIAKERRR